MSITTKSLAQVNKTLSGIMSIKDYGARGDGTTDDTVAFNLMIADINSKKNSYFIIPAGNYRITEQTTSITENFNIQGAGSELTQVLFDDANGFVVQFSDTSVNQRNAVFSDIGFLTNVNTRTGIDITRVNEYNTQGTQISLRYCSFNTYYDVGLGGLQTDEWLAGLKVNSDNVDIDNCFFNGSFYNIHNLSTTTSKGIYVNECSNVKLNTVRMYGWGTGVYIDGQSEDVSAVNGLIVGVGKGMVYTNLTAPANNHVIQNIHVNSWDTCIEFTIGTGDQSAYNIIKDCLFLEREEASQAKATWTAMNLDCNNTIVKNMLIQAGTTTGAAVASTGCKISDLANRIDIFKTVYIDTQLDIIARSIGNNEILATGLLSNTGATDVVNSTIYTKLGSNATVGSIQYKSGYAFNI